MAKFKERINLKNSIKQKEIIKGIFLFLDRKQSLNIMIYNKTLQGIFEVDIESYKQISSNIK